jgi:hypothetical protein
MENGKTEEKLMIKKMALSEKQQLQVQSQQKVALISRYPLNAGKQWIEANEQETLDWDFDEQNRKICLNFLTENAM